MAFVGESALSAFFEVLFDKFASSDFKFVTDHKQIRKEIEKWEQTLKKIHAVLADAEAKQMQSRAVKIWLADLKDLAYDVDDILDEFATDTLGRKLMEDRQAGTSMVQNFVLNFGSSLRPSTVMFNNKMMSNIKGITKRLDGLAAEKGKLQLRKNDVKGTVPKRPQSSSLVNEAEVYGRKEDKEKILDLLLRNDGDAGGVSVIPIVGMAGIGKTTLAQLVYNDNSIKDHFDLKAWVCVSDEFDIVKITKTILQSITSEWCDKNDLNLLQVKLKEKLSSRKFLLVLDDIWNEKYNDWKVLRSPFDVGIPGSKIIVTTRNSNVSSIMRTVADFTLQSLSYEDSLSMLAHHALERGDFTEHPDLEEIGLEIVKKCGGLPLAIKTIGGLLRNKVDCKAWKDILESDIWNQPEEKSDVVPALWLSYYYLPSQLKQCFAYCSIIPKDYEFNKEEIVLLWMAEGFLNGANSKRKIEDLGSKYFEELVARSFFQASSKNKSLFLMHDLINDLAQFVGGETYFKKERHEEMKYPRRVRHSSYIISEYNEVKKFETFFEAKSLRTYLSFKTILQRDTCYLSRNVLNDLLPRLKCLRVLSLKRYCITKIPDFIGNLKHLRYLDFSYTMIKGLPDSICTLCNLEILLLRFCEKLETLPVKIENLHNLCYLDISPAKSMMEMPSGIGKLTNLLMLSNFVVGQGGGLNIKEMQNLSNLRGQLSISELQNVDEVQSAREADLSSKSNLDELELKWSIAFNEKLRKKEVETEVLKLLQPHKQLNALAIKYYAGETFPIWIEDHSFKNLQSIKFEDCRNCTLLPAVGKLPLLRDLYIKGMRSVTSVGEEFYGKNWPNTFPSLEILHFEDMPEWTEWKRCEQGRKFYCLRELLVKNCPKLVETFLDCHPCLEKLVIHKCQELLVPISNLPMLCELEIEGAKEVVLGSYDDLCSVKTILLSDIAKFACVSKEMIMVGGMKIEDLNINGCEELASLWQTKWGWLAPLRSLLHLSFENCPQVACIKATNEEENADLLQLEIPCNIEYLRIEHCEGFQKLSKTLHNLTCLKELRIVKCPKLVSILTDSLPPTLKSLLIEECASMQCLLDDMENINFSNTSLIESLDVRNCVALKSLSSSGKLSMRLKSLRIWWCRELKFLANEIGGNTCLQYISILGCGIEYLPQGMDKLSCLQCIGVQHCPNLVCFPESGLPSSANLKTVWLDGCEKLEALPNLYSLQVLSISDCPMMKSMGEWGFPTNLTSLLICEPNISKAVMEWGLNTLTSLRYVIIDGRECIDTVSFPPEGKRMNMKLPSSLTFLFIRNFKNLCKLSSKGFQNLTSLQSLWISNCPKLKSLPKKEMLPSLLQLLISDCPVLKKRCKRDRGKLWSNIAHIPKVEIDGEFIYE